MDVCKRVEPILEEHGDKGHTVSCHLYH